MLRFLIPLILALGTAGPALAERVTYVLETPGVVCGGTAKTARAAVESVDAVESVTTDMDAHTLTVSFDDEKTSLDDVVGALNKAGYTVPEYRKTSGDG